MPGALLKIRETLDSLNPSERIVADYIVKNPREAVGLSISELAEKSHASRAAVIRFCKSLHYSGYRDFTISLASEMAVKSRQEMHQYTDIRVGDDTRTIAKNVCLNNVKAINDSFSILDYSEVEKAAQALSEAERIDFYGCGASAIVAMDAQQKFLRINKFASAYQDLHLQITSASNLGEGAAAVAISWSGETRETLDAATAARESGATLIAITKFGSNPLADLADIRLQLVSPETTIRCGAMSSRIAQLNLIDILYSTIVSRDYEKVCMYLENTRNHVSNRKYTSRNEGESKP